MTFDRFENWIKSHKIFSFFLTVLFVFVTFFQATDTFTRVKSWFSPDIYNTLSLRGGQAEYIQDPIEENIQVKACVDILYLSYQLSEVGHKALSDKLANADNQIWLVNIDVTDIAIEDSENPRQISLNKDMGFTVNIEDGIKEHTRYEIHFPQINTERQWSDFTHTPVSASYGHSTNTAFYRLVAFRPKGSLEFIKYYKAEYIVPETEKAQATMTALPSSQPSEFFKSTTY